MTNSKRQPYGFGSFVKKITRPIKKIVKSPLGKAALIGGLGYLAPKAFGTTWGGPTGWGSKIAGAFGKKKLLGNLIYSGKGADRSLSLGKMGLLGLLGAGTALPFMGGDDEEEIIETPWEETPASIANITAMARNRDPSLSFLPQNAYTQSGFYAADGGLAKLANGGGVAEAQAEQMLKMQYQKYRNQGGTMSYQQFKMTVLKQAQGQGPMAQEHLQRAAKGGRIGLANGGVIGSHVRGYTTPPGYNQFDYPSGGVRVGKAEGGLMSLGGMEKDYRQEGGFVPLGKEEKADDVPARLSKNEFVFTADAVKAAGGGDIDAGAEVMQNVMTNLEGGGTISEESQGAQGMYNQQQMLQSRMA